MAPDALQPEIVPPRHSLRTLCCREHYVRRTAAEGAAPHSREAVHWDHVSETGHLLAAVILALGLGFSPAVAAIGFGALVVIALIRLPVTWPAYKRAGVPAVLGFLFAWAAWTLASLWWSHDVASGLHLVRALRNILIFFLLWPVAAYFWSLVGSFLSGVFGQNLVQMAQYAGWITWTNQASVHVYPAGFMHVSHMGCLCVAAMAWHLPRLGFAGRRGLVLSAAGLIAAAAGLAICGNRAAMLAALVIPLLIFLRYLRSSHRSPAHLFRLTVAMMLLLAAGCLVFGNAIAARFSPALTEARDALDHQHYGTSIGLRVGMWDWAYQAWRSSPVVGIGMGGFQRYANALVDQLPEESRRQLHDSRYIVPDHAHSILMNTLATTGLIGLLLFLFTLILAFRLLGAIARWTPTRLALACCLAAWVIAALFDTFTVSDNMLAVFCFFLTLALMDRLREDGGYMDVPSSAEKGA